MDIKLVIVLLAAAVLSAQAAKLGYRYTPPQVSVEGQSALGDYMSPMEASGEENDPAKYDFVWRSKDYSGNDFGHHDSRDGDNTEGSYFVLLPDGRLQTVTYYVDGDSGFVAEVKYEGVARYPDEEIEATREGSDESEVSETPHFSGYAQRGSSSSYGSPQERSFVRDTAGSKYFRGYPYTQPRPSSNTVTRVRSAGSRYSRTDAGDANESKKTSTMSSIKSAYSPSRTESSEESMKTSRSRLDESVESMEETPYYEGPRYYYDSDASFETRPSSSPTADDSEEETPHFSHARPTYLQRSFDDSREVSTPKMRYSRPQDPHDTNESRARIYTPPSRTSFIHHSPRPSYPSPNSQRTPHFTTRRTGYEASEDSESEPETRDPSPRTRYSTTSSEDSLEEMTSSEDSMEERTSSEHSLEEMTSSEDSQEEEYMFKALLDLLRQGTDDSQEESMEVLDGYGYEAPGVPFAFPH